MVLGHEDLVVSWPIAYHRQCVTALAQTFSCSANGRLFLYRVGGESDVPCQSIGPTNPFLSRNDEVRLVWSGPAQVGVSVAAKRDRRQPGTSETQQRTLTIVPPIRIETGLWAIVELFNERLGGLVVSVARDTPPLVELTADMTKPLPFPMELVLEN